MTRASLARAALIVALAAGPIVAFTNRELVSEPALRDWLAQAGRWAPLAFMALYAGATVLICRTQVRSRQAARLLAQHGSSADCAVSGGMQAWRQLGYPTSSIRILMAERIGPPHD